MLRSLKLPPDAAMTAAGSAVGIIAATLAPRLVPNFADTPMKRFLVEVATIIGGTYVASRVSRPFGAAFFGSAAAVPVVRFVGQSFPQLQAGLSGLAGDFDGSGVPEYQLPPGTEVTATVNGLGEIEITDFDTVAA
jgi:hypothetical protein